MGAWQTHASAANVHWPNGTEELNVGAAVSIHPGDLDQVPSVIPILYFSGQIDGISKDRPKEVYEMAEVSKAWAQGSDADH